MKTTTYPTIAGLVLSASAAPIDTSTLNNGHIQLQLDLNLGSNRIAASAFDATQLFAFSSMHMVQATPDQVVNGTTPTGGIAAASGTFNFGINAATNMICYNITLHNFQGDFESPATTATHIHEAARGASGPPRIAFPGCLRGPFKTGVMVDGRDSGDGFHVRMIEADPAAFMLDTHSSVALPGAVRGQLA